MKRISWLLALVVLLAACTKEELSEYPVVFTGEVTDITTNGAVFNAKLVAASKEPIVEYGFVWSFNAQPTITGSEKFVLRGGPETGVISVPVTTTLQEGIKYYVRAYARTSTYTTYGKEVAFTSLGSQAPAIHEFKPAAANIGDTILIRGTNFSYIDTNNKVEFGEFPVKVVKASQDSLQVVVPTNFNLTSSEVSVTIKGNRATAADKFTLIAPVVDDFHPKVGTFLSRVTISGKNLGSHTASLRVYFDELEAEIVERQDQSLVVLVPEQLATRETTIRVRMNNMLVPAKEKFRLEALALHDFSPKVALTGNPITLTGNNFSPVPAHNKVSIGGLNAVVTSASINKLEVVLPLQDVGYYPARDVKIKVEVIGESAEYAGTLLVNDKWFRLKDAPVSRNQSFSSGYTLANCFTYNNKAYIGLNNNKELWEYNPLTDTWTRKADFPGGARWYGTGFVIEDKIYFGTGTVGNQDVKDWWEYDISQNRWTQKTDFAGEKRTGAVAFQLNNTGYVGTGFLWQVYYYHHGFTDFWRYSPTEDSWEKAFDHVDGMWWGTAFTHSGKAYFGLGNYITHGYDPEKSIFSYTPEAQALQQIPDFPLSGGNNRAVVFTMGEYSYVRTTYSKDFYYYKEGAASWTRLPTGILTDIDAGIAFSAGEKAYIGLGRTNAMWEYDPNR